MIQRKVGDYWWVKLPMNTTLTRVQIMEMGARVTSMRYPDQRFGDKEWHTFKNGDLEFVEKINVEAD